MAKGVKISVWKNFLNKFLMVEKNFDMKISFDGGLVDDYIVLSQQYCSIITFYCCFGTTVLFAKRKRPTKNSGYRLDRI